MGRIWMPGGGGGADLDVVTAAAGDILNGKVIVGADGEPLVGSLVLTGNAADSQVLSGKTYYSTDAKTKRTGTMTNQGAKTSALNCGGSYTIPAGYHNGSGKVTANSLASQTGGATAADGDVFSGKTYWKDGAKRTGTMANQGAKTSALNCGGSYTIPAGYHNGSGKVTANSLASQTSATAAAGNILSGKTAWVNGTKITGTLAVQSAISFSAAALSSSSIRISWKNPSKGPWQGVFIQMSTSGNPGASGGTRKYTGAGMNPNQAGGNNYVDITGLSANTTYYFTCVSYTTNLGNGTSYNLSAKTMHNPGMFFAKDYNPYGLKWYPSVAYGSVTNDYFGVINTTYRGSEDEYLSPFRTTKPVGLDLYAPYKKIRLVFERGDADEYFEFEIGFQPTYNTAYNIVGLFRMTTSGTYTVDLSSSERFYNAMVSSYGKPSFFAFSIFYGRSFTADGDRVTMVSFRGGRIKELEFV